MTDAELERVRRDGHEGVYECSLCHRKVDFGSALTVWHAGAPFFGVCKECVEDRAVTVRAAGGCFRIVMSNSSDVDGRCQGRVP